MNRPSQEKMNNDINSDIISCIVITTFNLNNMIFKA